MRAIFLSIGTLFLMSCGKPEMPKKDNTAPTEQQDQTNDDTDTDYVDEEQGGPDFGPGLG